MLLDEVGTAMLTQIMHLGSSAFTRIGGIEICYLVDAAVVTGISTVFTLIVKYTVFLVHSVEDLTALTAGIMFIAVISLARWHNGFQGVIMNTRCNTADTTIETTCTRATEEISYPTVSAIAAFKLRLITNATIQATRAGVTEIALIVHSATVFAVALNVLAFAAFQTVSARMTELVRCKVSVTNTAMIVRLVTLTAAVAKSTDRATIGKEVSTVTVMTIIATHTAAVASVAVIAELLAWSKAPTG